MSADPLSEQPPPIPGFITRWFLFFRYFPKHLFQPSFFYGLLTKKHPVLWNNVMEVIARHKLILIKTKELEPLVAATEVYPDFQPFRIYGSSRGLTGIHKFYKSAAEATDVKAFYTAKLHAGGWILDAEGYGWKFRRQGLMIIVYPARGERGWNYVVSYVWEDWSH